MDIAIDCSGIVNLRFPGQGLNDIVSAGIKNICVNMNELYIGNFRNASDRSSALSRQEIFDNAASALMDKIGGKSLDVRIMRSPETAFETAGCGSTEVQRCAALNTIRISGRYGCPYVIIPPLPDGRGYALSEENRSYYLSLDEAASECGVTLLVENRCSNFNGHFVRSDFSDIVRLSEFINLLNKDAGKEIYGICMNSGSCNLCGVDMNEFLRDSGRLVKAVIVSENDGRNNISCLPFTMVKRGTATDWTGLIRGLRAVGFDGLLISDISGTASAFPPLLRPQLISLAASVADYFVWQIGIEKVLKKYDKRVLFGAGNMCNKYMNCYGKEYPPLFTCDNNSARWGDTVCGLEIRSPEALKELPEDCAVFICNIYYREIEKQLKDMEIKNPIEYFNDEHLPSFPYEWLEV